MSGPKAKTLKHYQQESLVYPMHTYLASTRLREGGALRFFPYIDL